MLAWGWAKAFGTGEVGLRSLSALFGAATVPVAYLHRPRAGEPARRPDRGGARRRQPDADLVLAGGPLLRAAGLLRRRSRCSSSSAPCAPAAGATWRSGRWPRRWRSAATTSPSSRSAIEARLAAGRAALALARGAARRRRRRAVGLALLPLIAAQVNPTHIGWIDHSPLSTRFCETGVSFLVGETGHVIAEPPRERYALLPAILIGVALLLVAAARHAPRAARRAARRWRSGSAWCCSPPLAALVGKDYVVERNLLPALVPLAVAAAIGFAAERARRLGLLLAVALCAYWLAFDIHVTQTPNLQRPDFRALTDELGPAARAARDRHLEARRRPGRASTSTTTPSASTAARRRVREIDVISKPLATGARDRLPRGLPPGRAGKVRAPHPYPLHVEPQPAKIPFYALRRPARPASAATPSSLDGPVQRASVSR